VIMDVYTRSIRGWYLSRNLDQDLTLTALSAPWHNTRRRSIIRIRASNMPPRLTPICSKPPVWQSAWPRDWRGHPERICRAVDPHLQRRGVDLSDYLDFADAYHQIGRFLDDVYMHKRIHSSLGYLTPVEFENQWSPNRPLARLLTKKRCFCVQFLGRSSG